MQLLEPIPLSSVEISTRLLTDLPLGNGQSREDHILEAVHWMDSGFITSQLTRSRVWACMVQKKVIIFLLGRT
ncbi:hypothetical protein CFN58_26510 [Pseudomonas avellanae]|uniref:Uncharacterized protein n=2 Tax=Pseudomonas syringae group TaxID=136849 RepID=A0A261WDV1_9PSED|nr:hypothetical protein JN853_14090 [Pseudomonas syringae pv. actinidiae ICMP 9853]ATV17720.1 hypothetical protein CT122_13185 [Pseudomonas syringae pv. actinidiae]EGH63849.1 hypothetical protein PSYAC_02871 [Pseudomonas syringae pv. actinidiae str. M302091]EPM58519.1 hypothetical protein A262_12572 [Pseudomonas syringae pv. actinidiae ICMP 19073]MBL3830329.1 hypothetical protein [Pseudomonas syringae pv. theae]OZI84160.1 hypothetical protein CFN58_26510 [Pseudomonas avellanae]